ncbi:Uncharacterized protein Rs2_09877 [Raphanus sativus]|nr:Uncharacterized protein Rs2_09877 [Raphanus sativus]
MVHDEYPWIIPFWVEITGIPLHLWTVRNLKNIGKKLGHVDIIELSAGRLLIDVDTRKPLLFNKKFQSREGDEVTILFKYDLLFKHCSHCGFLTHEEAYCPTKLEEQRLQAKEAGVFSRVHLPFEPPSRQSLLADRTDRDRYHNWSDRKYENRKKYKADGYKSHNYGSDNSAYGNWRDDRQLPHRDRPRDTVVRRAGDRSSSGSRYSQRYAPYEPSKKQTWRAKNIRETRPLVDNQHGDVLRLGYHEGARSTNTTHTQQADDDILVEDGPSRHSGRKIASAIVTPSRAQKTDHVTYRDKGESRATTFSPKEKETSKDDMDEGQMIGALQDMEMGEANSIEQENDGILETDMLDEPTDDLLGEELDAMEVGEASKGIEYKGKTYQQRKL